LGLGFVALESGEMGCAAAELSSELYEIQLYHKVIDWP
jgi:hypothetical protein